MQLALIFTTFTKIYFNDGFDGVIKRLSCNFVVSIMWPIFSTATGTSQSFLSYQPIDKKKTTKWEHFFYWINFLFYFVSTQSITIRYHCRIIVGLHVLKNWFNDFRLIEIAQCEIGEIGYKNNNIQCIANSFYFIRLIRIMAVLWFFEMSDIDAYVSHDWFFYDWFSVQFHFHFGSSIRYLNTYLNFIFIQQK